MAQTGMEYRLTRSDPTATLAPASQPSGVCRRECPAIADAYFDRLPPERRHQQLQDIQQVSHLACAGVNVLQLLMPAFGRQPIKIGIQDFGRGHDNTEWRAELMRNERHEIALKAAQFFFLF